MNRCPVCQEEQHADVTAFNHHVNAHFGEGGAGPSRSSGSRSGGMSNQQTRSGPVVIDSEDDFCPLCSFPLSFATPVERNNHVNSCIDSQTSSRSSMSESNNDHDRGTRPPPQSTESMVDTEFTFDENTLRTNGQNSEDDWVQAGWDGPATPGVWSDWVSRKVDKGDRWWDPVHGAKGESEIPPNFTPGVLPVLAQILTRSVAKGISRSAVLSKDAVHIKSSFAFDIGWGCGYRNALMAITALLQAKPSYRPPFSENDNGSLPGVRRIQGWIEEAWMNDFDPHGKKHFKGTLLGKRKWIGTSDLYAMFTYKGIPCMLYDFVNKHKSSKNAHMILIRWVKDYFNSERYRHDGETAHSALMRTSEGGEGEGGSVRSSRKLPLVLQHSGHSRLIVGYEETSRGEINLLVLDPGRTMHKDIRAEGIASLTPRTPNMHGRTHSSTSSLSRHSTRKPSHESMNFSRPYTNGASEITQSYDPPTAAATFTVGRRTSFADGLRAKPSSTEKVPRLEGGVQDTSGLEAEMEVLEEDEEIDEKGWVRKKVRKVTHPRSLFDGDKWKVPDSLQAFQATASQLSNHNEYQILEFTGGAPLTPAEREARKRVSSHRYED